MSKNFLNQFYKYISEAQEYQQGRADSLKASYAAKKEINENDIADLLNIAIVDELLAAFNYFSSAALSKTEGKADFDPEFQAHYSEELGHAQDIARRLNELGAPVMTVPVSQYLALNSVGDAWKQETSSVSLEILKNRRDEEIDAISFYKFILMCIERMKNESKGAKWDSTTHMLIKKIIADEEEHLYDLNQLLTQYNAAGV